MVLELTEPLRSISNKCLDVHEGTGTSNSGAFFSLRGTARTAHCASRHQHRSSTSVRAISRNVHDVSGGLLVARTRVLIMVVCFSEEL